MSREASIAIVEKMTSGVLSLAGEEGYPYGVPLSYVYLDGRLYFHSAVTGHKIDAIRRYDKASFCIIEQDSIVPAEFTTYFRSVILFGRVHIVEEPEEKLRAIELIAQKYAPLVARELRDQEIAKSMGHLCIIEMVIEKMSGKEAIELVKAGKRENEVNP